MNKLNSLEEFDSLIDSGKKVVFYFRDQLCPDCRSLEKFIDKIVFIYNEFTFIFINKNEFIEIYEHYFIYGLPSFLVYNNRRQIGRLVDKKRKTFEEVNIFLKDINN